MTAAAESTARHAAERGANSYQESTVRSHAQFAQRLSRPVAAMIPQPGIRCHLDLPATP